MAERNNVLFNEVLEHVVTYNKNMMHYGAIQHKILTFNYYQCSFKTIIYLITSLFIDMNLNLNIYLILLLKEGMFVIN